MAEKFGMSLRNHTSRTWRSVKIAKFCPEEITKDQASMCLDVEPPKLEAVRKRQKVVGELLWVLTRTRPDVMYSILRLGSNVTKATKSVLEAADQVQGYLLRTCSEGLTYKDDGKEPVKIQAFSDASYAPTKSHLDASSSP